MLSNVVSIVQVSIPTPTPALRELKNEGPDRSDRSEGHHEYPKQRVWILHKSLDLPCLALEKPVDYELRPKPASSSAGFCMASGGCLAPFLVLGV